MQLLPALSHDAKAAAAREQCAGRHLPYARHVDDHTIETRDGLLMQFIHLRGLLFETADTDEINYRKRLRDAMLQAVGSSRFAIYHHIVRRRVEPELSAGLWRRPSRKTLDEAWRRRPRRPSIFTSTTSSSPSCRRPLQGKVGASPSECAACSAAPREQRFDHRLRAAPARRRPRTR
jgi:type IV secretion system protein VirB4